MVKSLTQLRPIYNISLFAGNVYPINFPVFQFAEVDEAGILLCTVRNERYRSNNKITHFIFAVTLIVQCLEKGDYSGRYAFEEWIDTCSVFRVQCCNKIRHDRCSKTAMDVSNSLQPNIL
jgi:hypothetical protein